MMMTHLTIFRPLQLTVEEVDEFESEYELFRLTDDEFSKLNITTTSRYWCLPSRTEKSDDAS